MNWQFDSRRQAYFRRLTKNLDEVTGRLTNPSDEMLSSLPNLLPLIDLFNRQGEEGWEYAPGSRRLTGGKVQKISNDILEWAVGEGLIVRIERNGKAIAYRTSEAWHSWLLEHASPLNYEPALDWSKLELVFQKYGRLGLRIAAQLAFGNSHALDAITIPIEYKDNLIFWRDAIPSGANIIRVGGRVSFKTPYATFSERWAPPGHFIWSWDISELLPETLKVASKILVVENPYAYWHMLTHLAGQDWTLICLHGETRQSGLMNEDADLFRLVQLMVKSVLQPEFKIWCDPDPGGVVMATNMRSVIERAGGRATFCMMDECVLDKIESISLADEKLLVMNEIDNRILHSGPIHKDLTPLSFEMGRRQKKGEQECLALVFQEDIMSHC
jgi:hypothetical protein